MAEEKEYRDQNSYPVTVSSKDVEFVVTQINSILALTNKGQRVTSHLAKRIRKSKAILLTSKERAYDRCGDKAPGYFKRLLLALLGK